MVAGEQSRYEECKKQIHDTVRQRIDLSREVTDAEIQDMIDDLIVGLGRKYALSLNERQELGKSVFYAIRKMDVLQELIDCDEGELEWMPKEKVYDLPIWEGDKIFFRLLEEERPFFSLKLSYNAQNVLVRAALDGKEPAL